MCGTGRAGPATGCPGAYGRARGHGHRRAQASMHGTGRPGRCAPGVCLGRQLPAGPLRRRAGRIRHVAGSRGGGA
ncbi:hypothetical protein G6F66_015738 [Rhizopus arrhizus]|uniref:Uncharacterized protein n=1 Tax=Rhizopus delemar TaxID=936053 RepID=A0A9P6XTA4_9FUNG|nr:hypothetical protein G6F23_014190 [Rhizopus arrhizus]KAG1240080.1 hypothetical protein G6F66_015738 [Rhizopus arrhizus]KAG1532095.1 hypothetical protein G6F50_016352 [Rhizopus delemar]